MNGRCDVGLGPSTSNKRALSEDFDDGEDREEDREGELLGGGRD